MRPTRDGQGDASDRPAPDSAPAYSALDGSRRFAPGVRSMSRNKGQSCRQTSEDPSASTPNGRMGTQLMHENWDKD